jgi:hypothetical protein
LTVLVVTVFVVGVLVSAAGKVLVSIVVGAAVSGVGDGMGAGVGVTTGAGSVVTGLACWAAIGVDESARAAAIAGRALVRAYFCAFLIMVKNTHARTPGRKVIVRPTGNVGRPTIRGTAARR